MKNPIDIQVIYDSTILDINDTKKKELEESKSKDQTYYQASSAGRCSRMIYYETRSKINPTDEVDKRVRRLFRLDDLIYSDIQNAFKNSEKSDSYYNIYNIYINNIYIKKEIILKKIRVSGFPRLIVELGDGRIYLYDVKSSCNFAYRKNFSTKRERKEPSLHHELEAATYGLAVEKEFGRLDGMYIIYYNKDNSMLRYKAVSEDRLLTALGFWERINNEHASGLPTLQDNISPIARWECNYCAFKTRCEEDRSKGL